MKIDYTDDVRKKYMVIEPDSGEECFEEHMLSLRMLKGILDFEPRYENGVKRFYYDTGSMKKLSEEWEEKPMSMSDAAGIFIQLKNTLGELASYMISEATIFLDADHAYIDCESGCLKLCAVPGEKFDLKKGVEKLTEFVLMKAKEDADTVLLARELYSMAHRSFFDIDEMVAALDRRRRLALGAEEIDEQEAGDEGFGFREVLSFGGGEGLLSEKIGAFEKPAGEGAEETSKDPSLPRESPLEEEEELDSKDPLSFIKPVVIAAALMIFPPVAIYVLRGEAALIRFIPMLAVADLGIVAFNIVNAIGKTKRAQ